MLDDKGKYRGASNLELALWPGSGLRSPNARGEGIRTSNPKWIVCSEIIETTDRFARTAARIDPTWIERVLGHCLKYAYDEPHFSRRHGSAMVMRRGTLYGLPAVARHPVPLAPLDPKLARELMIEHGLAEQQLESRASFWKHNQRFLEELERVGAKTRRRDCIADPFLLIEFYRKSIPDSVVDRVSLEKWDKSLSDPSQPPYLSWESLDIPLDADQVTAQFPDRLACGSASQLPQIGRAHV